jgi:hypothetical protein
MVGSELEMLTGEECGLRSAQYAGVFRDICNTLPTASITGCLPTVHLSIMAAKPNWKVGTASLLKRLRMIVLNLSNQ